MMKQLLTALALLSFLSAAPAQGLQWAPAPVQSAEVYFEFGKHDLLPAADSVLLSLAKYCRGNYLVKITAHTDSIGTLANNQALSQRRADAVTAFLESNGVDKNAIQTTVFGETRPIAVNSTDQGRQQNRRATVEVFKAMPVGVVEGTVVNEKTNEPVVADVILHTKDSRDTLRTDDKGYFKKLYPVGVVVGIDAYAKCFFLKSDMVKATAESNPVRLPLKPATSGEAMDINNLYYVGNQAQLLEESKPELPKILRFLQLNPDMKIEIAGHVNLPNRPDVSKDSWEYRLSVARAKMVHDYLLENGVDAGRITFKGYGNWEMRFPKAISEEQQALNRRVEIRILEGGCQ